VVLIDAIGAIQDVSRNKGLAEKANAVLPTTQGALHLSELKLSRRRVCLNCGCGSLLEASESLRRPLHTEAGRRKLRAVVEAGDLLVLAMHFFRNTSTACSCCCLDFAHGSYGRNRC
jgi:hypothetical protein